MDQLDARDSSSQFQFKSGEISRSHSQEARSINQHRRTPPYGNKSNISGMDIFPHGQLSGMGTVPETVGVTTVGTMLGTGSYPPTRPDTLQLFPPQIYPHSAKIPNSLFSRQSRSLSGNKEKSISTKSNNGTTLQTTTTTYPNILPDISNHPSDTTNNSSSLASRFVTTTHHSLPLTTTNRRKRKEVARKSFQRFMQIDNLIKQRNVNRLFALVHAVFGYWHRFTEEAVEDRREKNRFIESYLVAVKFSEHSLMSRLFLGLGIYTRRQLLGKKACEAVQQSRRAAYAQKVFLHWVYRYSTLYILYIYIYIYRHTDWEENGAVQVNGILVSAFSGANDERTEGTQGSDDEI